MLCVSRETTKSIAFFRNGNLAENRSIMGDAENPINSRQIKFNVYCYGSANSSKTSENKS
jgi:hypothetical protein